MSLYPSLEDMKVDQLQQAQRQYEHATQAIQYPTQGPPQYPTQGPPQYPTQGPPQYPHQGYPAGSAPASSSLYPALDEYMGLHLTPEFVAQNMPLATQNMQVALPRAGGTSMMVAPVSGNDKGIKRAEIKQGIREVICCKDQEGKIGLRLRDVNKGLFVALVQNNSPAALAGLRFGDQVLQINGENVAGWDTDKAHKVLKKASGERITFALRDRPFERTITLQKDSGGYIGFVFKDGRIKSLVKDSSACRNGLLIDHQLIEVNGQNVVGVKDEQISAIIDAGGRTVTVTIMPCFLYDYIVKCMGNSIVKKLMDHSIPDV